MWNSNYGYKNVDIWTNVFDELSTEQTSSGVSCDFFKSGTNCTV